MLCDALRGSGIIEHCLLVEGHVKVVVDVLALSHFIARGDLCKRYMQGVGSETCDLCNGREES